jgi:membrane associated rhomboid family serine protease
MIASPFTYQFLHGGWVHVGVNMVTLGGLRRAGRAHAGARRFVLFYLSAGIVAG